MRVLCGSAEAVVGRRSLCQSSFHEWYISGCSFAVSTFDDKGKNGSELIFNGGRGGCQWEKDG